VTLLTACSGAWIIGHFVHKPVLSYAAISIFSTVSVSCHLQSFIIWQFWFGLKLCDNKILYGCSKWLCYNAKFVKLCSEYNMDGSNYCMHNVYLRFDHIVRDSIV